MAIQCLVKDSATTEFHSNIEIVRKMLFIIIDWSVKVWPELMRKSFAFSKLANCSDSSAIQFVLQFNLDRLHTVPALMMHTNRNMKFAEQSTVLRYSVESSNAFKKILRGDCMSISKAVDRNSLDKHSITKNIW